MAFIVYTAMFVGAFIAGLGAAIGIWAVYRYSTMRSEGHFVAFFLWLLGLSTLAVVVFSARVPTIVGTPSLMGGSLELVPTFFSSLVGKVSTISLVGLAAIRCVVGSTRLPKSSFNGGLKGDFTSVIYYSYLLYFIFCGLLNSLAGTQPAFVHFMFYPVLIFSAIYFSRQYETSFILKQAKWILLVLIYGSLIAALFFHKFALETGYKGLIPGLTVRLYGLASHPNALGPVALLFLVLEYLCPSTGLIRFLHRFAAISVIVLAQSKTAYIASLVVIFILMAYRFSTVESQKKYSDARFGLLTALFLGSAIIGLSMLYLDLANVEMSVNSFFNLDAKEMTDLSTLTGRTLVWDITLKAWAENPLFGYGPTIWSPEFRTKYGLIFAGQAHNQFIQSLGESGIFGLIGLLVYISALLKAAFSTAIYSRGASLALVAIPLLRTWTESPFRNLVINDWSFFTHLLVFCLLLGLLREKAKLSMEYSRRIQV